MKKISSIICYFLGSLLILIYGFLELKSDFYLSEFGRVFLLCGSSIFLYFGGDFLSKFKHSNKPMKVSLWILFVLYCILFLTLTLFDPMWGRQGLTFTNFSKQFFEYAQRTVNIIPFATILHYIHNFHGVFSFRIVMYNLIGNFVCLMPLAFFLPLMFEKQKNWKYFLLTTTGIVCIIEILQLLTLSGSADIDDVILNVFGAFCMYQILKIEMFNRFIKKIFLLEAK